MSFDEAINISLSWWCFSIWWKNFSQENLFVTWNLNFCLLKISFVENVMWFSVFNLKWLQRNTLKVIIGYHFCSVFGYKSINLWLVGLTNCWNWFKNYSIDVGRSSLSFCLSSDLLEWINQILSTANKMCIL